MNAPVTEMKGDTIPMGPERINMTLRQPMGVVARILAFNHPFMFCGGKMAAPLAAGNAVIIKPPVQAPLSSLRLAELIDGLLPKGTFNVLPGGAITWPFSVLSWARGTPLRLAAASFSVSRATAPASRSFTY